MNDTSKRLDVLVVDDSVFFTESMGHVLRENDLKVATINDSTKVMDFLKQKVPDLILLDIMMPELDGISLCKMIKGKDAFRNVRIVIFSTKLFEADKEKAYQAGAEAFITKSVPIEEIAAQVLRILRKKMRIRFWGTRGSIPTPGPETSTR